MHQFFDQFGRDFGLAVVVVSPFAQIHGFVTQSIIAQPVQFCYLQQVAHAGIGKSAVLRPERYAHCCARSPAPFQGI